MLPIRRWTMYGLFIQQTGGLVWIANAKTKSEARGLVEARVMDEAVKEEVIIVLHMTQFMMVDRD